MVSHRALPSAPQPMACLAALLSSQPSASSHPRFTEVVHIHRAASSSSVGVSKGFVYLLLEVTVETVSRCICCLATVYCRVCEDTVGENFCHRLCSWFSVWLTWS